VSHSFSVGDREKIIIILIIIKESSKSSVGETGFHYLFEGYPLADGKGF